jgi:hypothetical protein
MVADLELYEAAVPAAMTAEITLLASEPTVYFVVS